MCSVELKYNDDTFKYIVKYLKDHKSTSSKGNGNGITVRVKRGDDMEWWQAIFLKKDKDEKPEVEYLPRGGLRTLKINGKTLYVHHSIGRVMLLGHDRQPTTPEFINISTWGTNTQAIKDFINMCIDYCMDKETDTIGIFELHPWGLGWLKVAAKKPRPLESVVLDKNLSTKIA